MKTFLKVSVLSFLITLCFSFSSVRTDPEVTIESPGYNGFEVGASMVVQGKATVAPEQYVWVFARREDFTPLWYPQGQAIPDNSDHSWYRTANFGEPQDIGHKFDIAIAVVNQQEHLALQRYWETAMQTRNWTPIKMPPTVVTPVERKVLKVK